MRTALGSLNPGDLFSFDGRQAIVITHDPAPGQLTHIGLFLPTTTTTRVVQYNLQHGDITVTPSPRKATLSKVGVREYLVDLLP